MNHKEKCPLCDRTDLKYPQGYKQHLSLTHNIGPDKEKEPLEFVLENLWDGTHEELEERIKELFKEGHNSFEIARELDLRIVPKFSSIIMEVMGFDNLGEYKKYRRDLDRERRINSGFTSKKKQEIKKRDQHKCVNGACQKNYSLVVHHLDGDETNNSNRNLVTLCRSCHYILHNGGTSKQKIVNQIVKSINRKKEVYDLNYKICRGCGHIIIKALKDQVA